MTPIDFLLKTFKANEKKAAIIHNDVELTYGELSNQIRGKFLLADSCKGQVRNIAARFTPESIANFLVFITKIAIIIPGTERVQDDHPLIKELRDRGNPGLILFSSGSTGDRKATLHDLVPLLEKFKTPKQSLRMISFLMFDHIGGINTLLYCLSNAGTLVTLTDRSPQAVVNAIEKHKVEVLPTSPTFLNMLLLSGACEGRDLSSLKLITYGTEPMPESTLEAAVKTFPNAKFQQTYGLSEIGILRSKSKANDSLWVKIGGDGFETRVVNGLLEIKADSAMMGYLNAPSPFTEDGWFKTQDVVQQDGEWFRILGRNTEIINVGGEKVYPAEIENILQQISNVESVVVTGVPSALMGQVVKATFKLKEPESTSNFKKRLRRFCASKNICTYKVPQMIKFTTDDQHTERFKKDRKSAAV